MKCSEFREQIEAGAPTGGEPRRHAATCRSCAEYAAAAGWSGALLQAGQTNGAGPSFQRLWAEIQRRNENNWAGALSFSFMRLVPYLAAFSLILLVIGTMGYRAGRHRNLNTVLWLAGSSRQFAGTIAPDMSKQPAATLGLYQP